MYAFSLLLRQTQINILNSLTRLSSQPDTKVLNFACQMTMAAKAQKQVEMHIVFCHAGTDVSISCYPNLHHAKKKQLLKSLTNHPYQSGDRQNRLEQTVVVKIHSVYKNR